MPSFRFIFYWIVLSLLFSASTSLFASFADASKILLYEFKQEYPNKDGLLGLKEKSLQMGTNAVPILMEVMKSSAYPDKNRWMATFLLGQIMGKKSSPYIAKYLEHPHWVMRMAGLKTLLALNEKDNAFAQLYAKRLQDDSLMVRMQALDNIRQFKLADRGQDVWNMLLHDQNYQEVKGKKRRLPILKDVIRTLGDLQYTKAKTSLLTMLQKKQYDDLFADIEYSLEKLTGQKAPIKASKVERKIFWGKVKT